MNAQIKEMIKKANLTLVNAYAPYSQFTVAACICTNQNNLYSGVNVENRSYGLSSCAEASAICSMVSSGEQSIKSIVVLAGNNLLCSPCGACRQKINEFALPDTMIYLCDKDSVLKSMTMIELLPLAFNFKPKIG